MSFGERYASAIASSRLTHEPDRPTDTDTLTAMGWAAKRWPLSHLLARLYAGDRTMERQLLEVLAEMAMQIGARRGLKRAQARYVASGVLSYHRSPSCRHCGGLGYRRVDGAPALSDHRCRHCRGSGQAPLRDFCGHRWEAIGREMVSIIEAEAGRAFAEAARKIRYEMDLRPLAVSA